MPRSAQASRLPASTGRARPTNGRPRWPPPTPRRSRPAPRDAAPRRTRARSRSASPASSGSSSIWQLIPTLGHRQPAVPALRDRDAGAAVEEFRDLEFWRNVGRTMTAWFIGLLIATVAATVLGTIIGLVPFLRRATHTTVEFLRPIPSVALIPLAVLIYGIQLQAALVIIVFASFWQVFVQVLYGVADVDAVARDTARSFGLSRRSGSLPRPADRAAVPHDGSAARGVRRPDPRDHRRDGDRQPRPRPRDRVLPVGRRLGRRCTPWSS